MEKKSEDAITEVDPATLLPNPYQVRRPSDAFDPSFDQLVESVRKTGLIELPIVRETKNGLQIAAGHRRVAACIKAGLKSIKCILRRLTDEQMAEVMLEENLKRKTLNPIEEARGYANFRDHFRWSEEKIAGRFQVTRDIVAQRLRLLTFQEEIQHMVAQDQLTASHAEAISTAPSSKQLELAQTVIDKKLTVKETAEIARHLVYQEKANRQALENIASRLESFDSRLADLDQKTARNQELLTWFEFQQHFWAWKAQSCGQNVNGFCRGVHWTSEPSDWIQRLKGIVRIEKLEDGNWHVQACSRVCAHCSSYERPAKPVSPRPMRKKPIITQV
jgi:ParB family chromosome partitioning protein